MHCTSVVTTTKLKILKKVETNNNIEMQDKCFSEQEEGGGGGEGREYMRKKMLIMAWVLYGPQTYTKDSHVYLPVPNMQAQSVSV